MEHEGQQEFSPAALDALMGAIAPGEAAHELAQLDERLMARLCDMDERESQGVASGIAYWLLRDALTRLSERALAVN